MMAHTTKYTVRVWKHDKTFRDIQDIPLLFDDKVSIACVKIASALGISKQLYMWCNSHISDKVFKCNNIVRAILQGRSHVTYHEFKHKLLKVFPSEPLDTNIGKSMRLNHTNAYNILMDQCPDMIDTRMMFLMKANTLYDYKFPVDPFLATSEDIPEIPLTLTNMSNMILYDFHMSDNMIHVIDINEASSLFNSQKLVDLYFPNQHTSFAVHNFEDKVYEELLSKMQPIVRPYYKKIYAIVHPIGPSVDYKLRPIFDHFVLDTSTALVKLRTPKDVIYKVNKAALETVPAEFRELWKTDTKSTKGDALIFKCNYGEFFGTVILYENLTYHVKLTFKNTQEVYFMEYVEDKIVPHINHVILQIKDIVHRVNIPLFSSNMIVNETVADLVMDASLHFSYRLPSIGAIEAKLLSFKQLFHKIYSIQHKAQNVIVIRYKKCSTYMPVFDINAFVKTHIGKVQRYELIDMLVETFQVSRMFAETIINEHADNQAFMSKNYEGVTIKLTRKNDIEVDVSVRGTHIDVALTTHIVNLINTCILHEIKASVKKKNSVTMQHFADDFFGDASASQMLFVDEEPYTSIDEEEEDDDEEDKEDVVAPPTIAKSVSKSSHTDFSRYTLRRLQNADPELFAYVAKSKNYKSYATNCAANEKRQPIVVSKEQLESYDKNTYQNSVTIGENAYICPKVWCTVSEIPMTVEQYKASGCPRPDDVALQLHDNNDTKYVGFLDPSKHPKEACVPCCFLVDHRAKEGGVLKKRYEKCAGNSGDDGGDDGYVKGANAYPLEANRFGRLPFVLAEFLDSEECNFKAKPCFVRKGVQHNGQFFLSCLANVLQIQTNVVELIQDKLKPHEFIFCNLIKTFIGASSSVFDEFSYKVFREWFLEQTEYVDVFHLGELKKKIQKAETIYDLKEPYSWEAQREFVIFVAMQNFMSYLQTQVAKDHTHFAKMLACKWLNPQGINIIILERVDEDVFVHVPERLTPNEKYTFMVKYRQFYDPIYKIHNQDQQFVFDYSEVSHIVDFVKSKIPPVQKFDVPFPIVDQVVNTKYEVVGYTTKNGYVPLAQPTHYNEDYKVVYQYDVVVDKTKQQTLLKKLQKLSPFYKFSVTKDGILMGDNETLLPFAKSHKDLHIFAGIQLQNSAISFLEQWNLQQSIFYGYMKSVTAEILDSPHTKNEFEFLRSPDNFFQYDFKLKMMIALCKRAKASRGMGEVELAKMADAMLVREIPMLLTGSKRIADDNVQILTQDQLDTL